MSVVFHSGAHSVRLGFVIRSLGVASHMDTLGKPRHSSTRVAQGVCACPLLGRRFTFSAPIVGVLAPALMSTLALLSHLSVAAVRAAKFTPGGGDDPHPSKGSCGCLLATNDST